jgi:hypothetical protein
MHGFDVTRMPEMKALFVAAGPDIRPGVALEPFENVDVYPLIAKILGLEITNLKTGPIDGKLSVLEGVLKRSECGLVIDGRGGLFSFRNLRTGKVQVTFCA